MHRAFLASCRVLTEGVDITGERGVEAICFADTRGSQVEIVQNIGRALRLKKDTKVARIIVPVFLEPSKDRRTWSPAPRSAPLENDDTQAAAEAALLRYPAQPVSGSPDPPGSSHRLSDPCQGGPAAVASRAAAGHAPLP